MQPGADGKLDSLRTFPDKRPRQPLIYFFIVTELDFLDISYKRNNTTHSLLCLTSFTKHDVFEVHPHHSMCL